MSVLIKGIAGMSGGGGKCIGGTSLSSAATTSDEYAEFSIISKANSSSADTSVFAINIDDLPLGTYAIMIRMKSSNVSSANNLLKLTAKLNNSSGTTLGECVIKANMFNTANKYETLGFIVNLNDKKDSTIYLTATLLTNATSITVGIDYILVSPAFTSVSAIG